MDPRIPDRADAQPAHPLDDAIPAQGCGLTPVVGLGGSAGSIPALTAFMQTLPPRTGLACVVVIHLPPTGESQLAALLQRHTAMRVVQVQERTPLLADTVYVIPPGRLIRSMDGQLELQEQDHEGVRHVTVDLFFRTLAETHGPHAAAVVLSGGDSDGAVGIKRIKERGGLTVAQDPGEAEHDGMPRAAIQTGMVDWVLPAGDMAARLLEYFRLEPLIKLPSEDGPMPLALGQPADEGEAALRDVLNLLRTRTGRDFGNYKRATILRRIGRRMQVNGIEDLPGYLACLRTRPGEAGALLHDLLISVTNFFRDADCFVALQAQIARAFAAKRSGHTVRAWVAACATGEEAYSVAMLLCEQAQRLEAPPAIQVFATDLDEQAIQVARDGLYPLTIEADVSEERLRRFFTKEHRGYRVRRELRELILFAVHDVLKDSPFSRLDLVSCRNLLIYLNRNAQARVMDTFHFALKPHGLLFLGSSESVEEGSALFAALDKKHRLYGHRPTARTGLPVPPGRELAPLPAIPLQARAAPVLPGRSFDVAVPAQAGRTPEGRRAGWGEVHLELLELLAPPSILVDGEHDIVHLSPSAGRFLLPAGGEPTRNLLRTIHPSLRVEVRAALYRAAQSRLSVDMPGLTHQLGAQPTRIDLRVVPAPELDLFLILLQPADGASPAADIGPPREGSEPLAQHLDRELERLKVHLRDTVEQHEASTEELKASNEELQAMNEELRSATEELETSREELQSINEEMTTVNQELKNKVEELGQANSDMQNLMDATAIATVFLDRALRITRYTPSAVTLFNLIPTDVGRPLTDLTTPLQYPQLDRDAHRVLERLAPVEREVGHPDGRWYLARLLPYRTVDDRIAGLVLSFFEITERKHAEEVRVWLSTVVNSTSDGIVSFALDLTVLSWNAGAERIFGYTAEECIGSSLAIMAPGQGQLQRDNIERLRQGQPLNFEAVRARKDGSQVQVALSVAPIRDAQGLVIGATAVVRDVTEARRAAEALRASEDRLRLVVESAREYAIFSFDLDRRVTSWNSGAERLLGYPGAEVLGNPADVIFTEEDRLAGAPQAEADSALADGRAADDRMHVRKDGSRFWAEGVVMPMRDTRGEPVGFVKVLRDQTEQRQTQQALRTSEQELTRALQDMQAARRALEAADAAKDRFLAVLSHELRNPLASIASASELLLMPKLPEAALRKAAEVVQRQARAMKVLLDELLDVSRLALGRMSLSRRRVPVAAFLQNGVDAARPLVQAAGHELLVRLPETALEVDGDPVRLAQVVSNLVGNSAKYTPEGGRIEVSVEVVRDEVVVCVADNGIGMDPAQIEHMFDLFSQGEPAPNQPNSGLGIGLALARNIVELHAGWILASSAGPGQGCQMRFGLALLHPAQAAALPMPTPQPLTRAPAAQGELVLVADDNGDAAWGLAKLLELSGFRAVLARSGAEALQVAEQQRPPFALLDIGMPDLSGHEVARRLRREPWGRAMILIAATGWGQESDVRQSMEAGFDAHLTKPLNIARIQSVLQDVAARRASGGA